MVFFTCNACGSSLKKNQVEKHYQNECRSCSVLSCMDCGQDFYGDDYAGHTQCISEAEKYQGSLFKGTGNKGDKKQQEWLEKARMAMRSAKVNPKLKSLLERVSEYPNIPRKKSKFENFVRNSCNVWDQRMLEELWDIFNQDAQPLTCATSVNIVDSQEGEKLEKEEMPQEAGHDVVNSESLMKKKNKIKVGKPCETEIEEEVECHGPVKKKKTKKRTEEEKVDCGGSVKKRKKQVEMRTIEEEVEEEEDCDGPVKKRKKQVEMRTIEEEVEEEEDCDSPVKKRKKQVEMRTEVEEEVDCDGPIKKRKKLVEMRTIEEEVEEEEDCDSPVKKRKKKTEMRTLEEDVDYDGPNKRKTGMRKVKEEQKNERKKKTKQE